MIMKCGLSHWLFVIGHSSLVIRHASIWNKGLMTKDKKLKPPSKVGELFEINQTKRLVLGIYLNPTLAV